MVNIECSRCHKVLSKDNKLISFIAEWFHHTTEMYGDNHIHQDDDFNLCKECHILILEVINGQH